MPPSATLHMIGPFALLSDSLRNLVELFHNLTCTIPRPAQSSRSPARRRRRPFLATELSSLSDLASVIRPRSVLVLHIWHHGKLLCEQYGWCPWCLVLAVRYFLNDFFSFRRDAAFSARLIIPISSPFWTELRPPLKRSTFLRRWS